MSNLLYWTPKSLPNGFRESPHYEDGDESAPFFSEAYLYNLIGKEDARTLLALMDKQTASLAELKKVYMDGHLPCEGDNDFIDWQDDLKNALFNLARNQGWDKEEK